MALLPGALIEETNLPPTHSYPEAIKVDMPSLLHWRLGVSDFLSFAGRKGGG